MLTKEYDAEKCHEMYAYYLTNFGSTARFAEHYQLTYGDAMKVLKIGRTEHSRLEKIPKHGEWVCPANNNASALPDENNRCSLCGAEMLPGYPEQKGND